MLKVKTTYNIQESTLETDRAVLQLGGNEGQFYPYDVLFGALSACFHATLSEIFFKRKVELPPIEIIVTGEKRKDVPTTLEWVNMEITVLGEVDEERFLRYTDMAAKYCSIHETISKVAEMTHEVNFAR